jgi:N-dimethylarginine dimethylaminohydrolase
MSLISLLDEKTALVDLPWLAVETVELLKRRGYQFIEIDAAERNTLGCNVLSLGQGRLVAIEENRDTNQRLRDASFKVFTFPGSEISINGAGGPTCLTRPLFRGAVDERLLAAKTAKNNRQGCEEGRIAWLNLEFL